MQKNSNLFYVAMTLYAFGFIASIVVYSLESPNSAKVEVLAKSASPGMPKETGESIKVISGPSVLIAPPSKSHDKKI